MPKVAINGLERIGRAPLNIRQDVEGVEAAAVNNLVDADDLAYLLAHDSVYGRYGKPVAVANGALAIDGHRVPVYRVRDGADPVHRPPRPRRPRVSLPASRNSSNNRCESSCNWRQS
jgi:glyceraldehyde-3-phosphate dehydrogenase/erythrose-4-phosphate dehydrogenase